VIKRLTILALVPIGVLTLVLSLWGSSNAATSDVAAASVDPDIALVGQAVTFTSTNPCTTACSLTWRRPDIGLARFGGVIIGRGEQFSLSFAEPGAYQVVLDMGETCDGTTQLVCHSYAMVIVEVVTELPPADGAAPPPEVVPTDPTLPPETTLAAEVTLPPDTTLPPETTLPAETLPPETLPPETLPPETTLPADPGTPDVQPDPQLVAPSDLTVTVVGRRNRLTWTNPASSASSIVLERCSGIDCTDFRQVTELAPRTTSFIESRTRHGADDITYRLAVSDAAGNTVYSNLQTASMRR
jgi:hypothetical protein